MKTLEKRTSADDSAVALLEVVPQVMRLMRSEMRSHRGGELSMPQFRTLGYLDRYPGSALLDVTAHIGLMPPSMSKLVDGLIARKLMSRHTSASDRRRLTLSLTAQGKATLQRARRHLRECLAEVLAGLTDVENETVQEASDILRRAFTVEGE